MVRLVGMRIIQKTARALWGVTLPEDFTNLIPARRPGMAVSETWRDGEKSERGREPKDFRR
jgi:hypothetical protein